MVGCYAAGHSDYLLAYGQILRAYRLDISSYPSQFQFVLRSIDPRNRLVSLLHAAHHLLFVVISMLYMRLTEFYIRGVENFDRNLRLYALHGVLDLNTVFFDTVLQCRFRRLP